MKSETFQLSQKFRIAVKMHPNLRGYQIAQKAKVNPTTLSRLICGIEPPRGKADPRVVAVAKVIGLDLKDCIEIVG